MVSAIIVLGVLIFVHELGHFLLAKKAGVGVKVFSLGFGPRLIGFKKGETDYRLSAIPLGGFVRMVGENPGDEVTPEEQATSFAHKKVGWRLAIVAAGPLSNIVFALVVYFAVLMLWGLPTITTQVGGLLPGSPALAAGVQKGDKVLAINGQPTADWGDMVRAIQKSGGQPLQVALERNRRQLTVTIAPRQEEVTDIFGEKHQVFRVGIAASQQTVTRPVGLMEATELAFRKTYWAGELIIMSVVKIIQAKVSVENLGGPIMIAQVASEAASHGLAPLLDLAALISVNLAILNLLPIPALDGGHIFFFLYEAVTRRPVSVAAREKAQQVGMVLLILLMIFIFYNDIARLLGAYAQ
ncbi:MAG: RIP metalloprotease RseP [Proteobacteria bacterium]|nr:RIP metalloprotease RseP [Pseudomonadota bacterium]MBU1453029.1 RIP metalloprotease RseP [Pseudomonadota bacterium]